MWHGVRCVQNTEFEFIEHTFVVEVQLQLEKSAIVTLEGHPTSQPVVLSFDYDLRVSYMH